jgi:hypothetical protein
VDGVSCRFLATAFVVSVAHLLNRSRGPSTRPPPLERVIDENTSRPSWREGKVRANKMECWWPACCLLVLATSRLAVAADGAGEPEEVRLAGGLSTESGRGPATDNSSDNNKTKVAERPEGGSRSERLALKKLHPAIHRIEWAMPLFDVEQCGEQNGYLCGVGIRLGKHGYFLASSVSVLCTTESLSKLAKNHTEPSGAFRFGQAAQLDISKLNNDAEGSKYNPGFKMIAHNIGVYIAQPRVILPATPYEGQKPLTHLLPRNSTVAPIRSHQGEPKNCMVLSY